MSSYYPLISNKETDFKGEFAIDENSNKLSLVYCDEARGTHDNVWFSTEELTPEEMTKIFLKGLTACSYWMDADKLKKMIKNHIEKEIY